MRNWSPPQNYMVPLRELPEWRFFTIVNKKHLHPPFKVDTKTVLHVSLFADLLHVSEREGDPGDGPLLSRHLHRHHRRPHGRLGWLLRLHDL